jgi:transcriptional regulator with XRE-family HTH domain
MPRLTLREARQLLGLSQQQLAERAGEKRSAIDDIENGRSSRPSYELVMNIFRALQGAGLNGIAVEDVFPLEPIPAERAS